ncbi:uncharacterized protein N7483_006983 [Penicillium malachiteum]|uniref:uncharacterized protein n=1 Tax=Penicillium malachiteum TaxID=1324776 RepID=UPI002548B754|nr:uncharacterized protein N7483_006983 [Penicillium malachiteum]KAJ5725626.1 hypothetical protein N7483_006983 [Penicillium malachiteum]
MHSSLSIGAVFALCRQVYSQDALGDDYIQQVETSGPFLYLGIKGPIPSFQDETHQSNQVWSLAPAGESLVTIQNTNTGDYINCGTSPEGRCELQEEGQVFQEERKSEDHDIYGFVDQSSSKVLVLTEDGALSIVEQSDSTKPELSDFLLTQAQCK